MVLAVNTSTVNNGTCSCCGDLAQRGQRLSYEGSDLCVTCYLERVIGMLPVRECATSATAPESVMRSDYLYHGDMSGSGEW